VGAGAPAADKRARPLVAAISLGYFQWMDWSVFHLLNGSLRGHPFIADGIEDFVTVWAVPVFVLAVCSLWFLDRPGGRYRWKTALLAGLTSAALGLLLSQVISHVWVRDRPFLAHPGETLLLVPPSHEPSFPSDHAVAAFALAFSVALMGGRRMGALMLAGASMIALSRVFVGLHYPGDIAGGALLGLASALVVYFGARRKWDPVVRLLSRLTDPLVAPAWRVFDGFKARHRN
jgi:undecaprenyl-diphosphatase